MEKGGKEQHIHLQLHIVGVGKVPFPTKHSGLCFTRNPVFILSLFSRVSHFTSHVFSLCSIFLNLSLSYQLVHLNGSTHIDHGVVMLVTESPLKKLYGASGSHHDEITLKA